MGSAVPYALHAWPLQNVLPAVGLGCAAVPCLGAAGDGHVVVDPRGRRTPLRESKELAVEGAGGAQVVHGHCEVEGRRDGSRRARGASLRVVVGLRARRGGPRAWAWGKRQTPPAPLRGNARVAHPPRVPHPRPFGTDGHGCARGRRSRCTHCRAHQSHATQSPTRQRRTLAQGLCGGLQRFGVARQRRRRGLFASQARAAPKPLNQHRLAEEAVSRGRSRGGALLRSLVRLCSAHRTNGRVRTGADGVDRSRRA
jgi:hypothetical protein